MKKVFFLMVVFAISEYAHAARSTPPMQEKITINLMEEQDLLEAMERDIDEFIDKYPDPVRPKGTAAASAVDWDFAKRWAKEFKNEVQKKLGGYRGLNPN